MPCNLQLRCDPQFECDDRDFRDDVEDGHRVPPDELCLIRKLPCAT